MSRKLLLTALLAVVMLVVLVAPGATQSAGAQSADARLRFVHAVPGAPNVDVYVDGALTVNNLAFGDYTPHLTLPAGEHRVTVRQAGAGDAAPALLEVPVPLTGGLAFSVIVQGTPAAPAASLYEDILDEIAPGLARLTAINAIADSPALDVLTTAGGPLLQGVSYGVQFGTVNIGTGVQDLVMVPAGGAVASAVATMGRVPLRSGMLYTFVALGALDGPVTPFALVLETPINGAAGSARVQVAHGSPDAGPVDVYGNDVLLFPNVVLGELTGHVALPAGDYTLAVRPAGAAAGEPALLTADVTLEAGSAQTVVVQGSVLSSSSDAMVKLTVFADPVGDVTPGAALVSVVNAVPGATVSATAGDAASTVLASQVSTGTQAPPLALEPGEYMMMVTIAGPATQLDLVVPAQPYYGGMYYTLLVFGDAASSVPFDARAAGTEVAVTGESLVLAGGAAPMAAAVETAPVEAAPVEAAPVEAAPVEAAPASAESEVVMDTASAQTEVVPDTAPAASAPASEPAAPVQVQVVQPTPVPDQAIGTVVLNPGANLHCRLYPNSQAQSLALIPSGSQLVILGLPGEPVVPETGEVTPEPTPVIETIEDLWLSVRYDTADGGYLRCWVAAQFLSVRYKNRLLLDLQNFIDAGLPTVPFNEPGEAVGTTPKPPTPIFNAVLATVQLEPGVSLQLRRFPSPTAEALARIPAQSQVEALSRVDAPSEGLVGQPTNPTWLQVRYRMENGASIVGWVSAQYVTLSQLGRSVAIESLPEGDPTEGGYLEEAGTPLIPPEMQDVIGMVTLNPGANLNLRDRPSVDGRVVIGMPSGTALVLNGRNGDGTWVQVSVESGGQKVEGWTASQYLTVTQGGLPYNLQKLPIVTGEPDTMGLTPTETPAGEPTPGG